LGHKIKEIKKSRRQPHTLNCFQSQRLWFSQSIEVHRRLFNLRKAVPYFREDEFTKATSYRFLVLEPKLQNGISFRKMLWVTFCDFLEIFPKI
jgi:hypothetical protein